MKASWVLALMMCLMIGFVAGVFTSQYIMPAGQQPQGAAAQPGAPNFEADLGFELYNNKVYLEGSIVNVGYKHISECTVTIWIDSNPVTVSLGSIASSSTHHVWEEIPVSPSSLNKDKYSATVTASQHHERLLHYQ